MSKKKTLEEFICQAKTIWGNTFDYSQSVYINANTPIVILCPIHGDFKCRPIDHLHKHGCPKCARTNNGINQRTSFDEFVKRAEAKHGERYEYAASTYTSMDKKVDIYCPIHNMWFSQSAISHVRGHGCPLCGLESNKNIIHGVAVNDLISVSKIKGKRQPAYLTWINLLNRTASSLTKRNKSYLDCKICDEWLSFNSFKEWFDKNYVDGYSIDKDILCPGNRCYSPQYCRFVPQEINSLFVRKPRQKHKELPTGVSYNYDKYRAQVRHVGRTIFIKTFSTIQDAREAYLIAKRNLVDSIADNYFTAGKISAEIRDAMKKFPLEIL